MAAVIKRETNKRMHLVIIILLLTGCVKDAEFSGDTKYPSLETLPVTDINKDGATLMVFFTARGKVNRKSFGSIGSVRNAQGYTYAFSDTVAIPSGNEEKFSLRVESALLNNNNYVCHCICINQDKSNFRRSD